MQKFNDSKALSAYLAEERELALTNLCSELQCDRDSLAFIINGSDHDFEALKIPRP